MRVNGSRILFVLTAFSAMSAPAFGQVVDPNLQVRIENALPPPDIQPQLPVIEQVPVQVPQTVTITETATLSQEQRIQRLQKIESKRGEAASLARLSPEELEARLQANGIGKTEKQTYKVTKYHTKFVPKVVPRTTQVFVAAQTQAAFDTNATKSNLARVSDWVATSNASLTVKIPIGLADSLVFQTGVADLHYAKLVSRDVEILANSASYVQVLSQVQRPGLSSPDTITVDAISYSFASSTVFGSGFRPYQVELFTPSVSWARTNINVGGTVCGPKDHEAYCIAGTAAASGEYTSSDVASQQNFAAKLQGGLKWQTPIDGLTTAATGYVQAKYFTDFPGGRQDLILQGAARVDYALTPTVTLSGVMQLTQQFSTVRALEWNGLALFPFAKLQIKL
jgi:hypothetical protein